jgi:hypothetical protein
VSHDFVVLNVDANDILYKNNKGVALTQITKYIQRNYGTNIIILEFPLRYDLSLSSYINSENNEFNRKLKKIDALPNHVSLIETTLKRECSTKHWPHWNSIGETLVFKLIPLQISKVLRKEFQTQSILYCTVLYLFQIPSDPYRGISSHTTGYRKRHFSLQNFPFTKEQVNGHGLYIQTYLYKYR